MLRQLKTAKRRLLTLCSQGLFDEPDGAAKKLATTKKLLKE